MLNVSRSRVHQLASSYSDFPAPAVHLASGLVWHTEDIREWLALHPERGPGTRTPR